MRVAHVNMSQSGVSCPQELTQKVKSELTLCGQSATGGQRTLFSELGLSYSQVCGQLQGYQFATTDAFEPYNRNTSLGVSDPYVDGASITYDTAVLDLQLQQCKSIKMLCVPVIQVVLLRFLPILVTTTTVRLVTMVLVAFSQIE